MSNEPSCSTNRLCDARSNRTSIITTRRARTCRWRKMHRRPDWFNRRNWGRSLNCRRLADCITATNGGRLEELFSD